MPFRRNSVDVREASRRAADGAILVDVRRKDEVRSGMAAGAIHIPQERLAAAVGRLDGSQVLVICRSGSRSAGAAALLRRNGIDARNVRGGMLAWRRRQLPTTSPQTPRRAR